MSDSPESTASQSAPAPARPLIYPSRVIVFTLFAVALAALGFDLVARVRAGSAFGTLQKFVDEEIAPAQTGIAEACTPSYVTKLLGRAPDAEEKQEEGVRYTYSWPGVFNCYHVHANFGGVKVAAEKAEDAEPLLERLEQSSNYRWEQ